MIGHKEKKKSEISGRESSREEKPGKLKNKQKNSVNEANVNVKSDRRSSGRNRDTSIDERTEDTQNDNSAKKKSLRSSLSRKSIVKTEDDPVALAELAAKLERQKILDHQQNIMISKAVGAEFLEYALFICSERYIEANKGKIIAAELRSTWIQIMESQWMDSGPSRNEMASVNFTPGDEPCLPLAFDTWSRGAIEVFPRVLRESIIDPFIRKFENLPEESESMAAEFPQESSASLKEEEETIPKMDDGPIPVPSVTRPEFSELDGNSSSSECESTCTDLDTDSSSGSSSCSEIAVDEQEGGNLKEIPMSGSISKSVSFEKSSHSVERLPTRKSTTSFEILRPVRSYTSAASFSSEEYIRQGVPLWSTSQCGARAGNGSGIFKFPNETSEEAMEKVKAAAATVKKLSGSSANRSNSDVEVVSTEKIPLSGKTSKELTRSPANRSNSDVADSTKKIPRSAKNSKGGSDIALTVENRKKEGSFAYLQEITDTSETIPIMMDDMMRGEDYGEDGPAGPLNLKTANNNVKRILSFQAKAEASKTSYRDIKKVSAKKLWAMTSEEMRRKLANESNVDVTVYEVKPKKSSSIIKLAAGSNTSLGGRKAQTESKINIISNPEA